MLQSQEFTPQLDRQISMSKAIKKGLLIPFVWIILNELLCFDLNSKGGDIEDFIILVFNKLVYRIKKGYSVLSNF